jgi:pyruvate/2-oxoglutarate dehydrogenase complex dihydrolipoamide acyltransferase (E2) component
MLKYVEVPPLGEQKQTETLLNFWYVEAGKTVQAGDDLAELVTDKAAFNMPAAEAGRIVRILVKEGEKVVQGQKLAEYESE